MKPKEALALQEEAKQLLELWQRFRNAMDLAFLTDESITNEHESAFLNAKSAITRGGRSLAQELPKDLQFDARKMNELIKSAISIQHFRGIPDAEIPQIRADWHLCWVQLSRATGGLGYLAEGGRPAPKKAAAPIKGKKAKKKNKLMVPMIVAGVIAAAVGAAFLFGYI